MKSSKHKAAEANFREAFERLKIGAQEVLPAGSMVSQNNVAREAGCDPSALRKSRFPSRIAEIQIYRAAHGVKYPKPERKTHLSDSHILRLEIKKTRPAIDLCWPIPTKVELAIEALKQMSWVHSPLT
jgi:hypothetical protein